MNKVQGASVSPDDHSYQILGCVLESCYEILNVLTTTATETVVVGGEGEGATMIRKNQVLTRSSGASPAKANH